MRTVPPVSTPGNFSQPEAGGLNPRPQRVNCAGLTLIDLMIAVAVVAILTLIAVPSYTESVRKVRRAEARAALMQLMQQQERYYSQAGMYMPFDSASTNANAKKFNWWIGSDKKASAYEIKGAACANESTSTCITLTAMPGTAKVNASYRDPDCGSLVLSSNGEKSTDPATTSPKCW